MLLYYITDRTAFGATEGERQRGLLANITRAAAAGVDLIQLREKDLTPRALEQLARAAVAAARTGNPACKILINSRADVARAVGADGVHLRSGEDELDAATARSLLMRGSGGISRPTIAVSCHTREELQAAWSEGADLAVFGPIFGKGAICHAGGIEALKHALRSGPAAPNTESIPAAGFPVLALGGVTGDNALSAIAAGAAGIAAVRLFQTGDVEAVVGELKRRNLRPTEAR